MSACSAGAENVPAEPTVGTVAEAVRVDPSTNPPGGFSVSQVPQFVSVTFDDNFGQDGVSWAISLRRRTQPGTSSRMVLVST
jgi:hypothetical protein